MEAEAGGFKAEFDSRESIWTDGLGDGAESGAMANEVDADFDSTEGMDNDETRKTAASSMSTLKSSSSGPKVNVRKGGAIGPEFEKRLQEFWDSQLLEQQELPVQGTDFKTHSDLPLARIKRIMKADEDVRMVSAEAPVVFARACKMFIAEITLRSWMEAEACKRKTLQKEDTHAAILKTDMYDFLEDVVDGTIEEEQRQMRLKQQGDRMD